MIASLLGLALVTGAAPLAAPHTARQSSLRAVPEARAWTEPEKVVIGEPFTLTLDVLHPRDQRVLLDAPPEGGDAFGDRWVVLEPRRVVRLPLGDGSERTLTQARWRLMGLEPGDHELTTIGADAFVPGEVVRLEPAVTRIEVQAELGPDEDAPRSTAGFREPPRPAPRRWRGLVLAWLGLVVVAGLGVLGLVVTRLRRSGGATAPPGPRERLAALDPTDEASRRDLHYAVSQLVRAAFDARDGARRSGLTDEEWAAAAVERGGAARADVERASRLLRTCAEVKYAQAMPTRFAAEELVTEARALLDSLERVPAAGEARP